MIRISREQAAPPKVGLEPNYQMVAALQREMNALSLSESAAPGVMLIGCMIVNRHRERLGEVVSIVTNSGAQIGGAASAEFVIASFCGFFGLNEKLFPVPAAILRADPCNPNILVLDVDDEVIDDAPGFFEDSWPDMTLPPWRAEIRAYYEQSARRPA